MVTGMRPMTSHEVGTSTASAGVGARLRSSFLKIMNERATVRQFNATCVRLAKTINDVPPHNAQRAGLKLPSGLILNEGIQPATPALATSKATSCGATT